MTQDVRVSETLRKGRPAEFIHWVLADGGWKYELIHGTYLGSLPDRFVVTGNDGEPRLLDRSRWMPVTA